MFYRLPGLFISVVLYFGIDQICEVEGGGCSKIYILPLLAKNTECTKIVRNGDINTYAIVFANFLNTCSDVSQNSVFNFNYSTTYTCLINNMVDYCRQEYNLKNNVTLERNKHHGVWSQFTEEVEKDKQNNCADDSLAIFVTDIPHEQFYLYPDIDSIFGYNLNMTLKYLFDEGIHAFAVWLNVNEQLINQPSKEVQNLTSFTEASYLEFHYMTYNSFFTGNGGKLCAVDNFPELSDYKEQNQHTLEKMVGIISGVILLLILLFIVFWSRQIYKRWKESKIEAFADEHTRSTKHIIFGKHKDEWEVTPKELKVDAGTVLGKGAFGVVYRGFLKKERNKQKFEMDVAVKFTTEHSDEKMRQDMISEIGFMKALGSHENLLVMVGYVKSIDNPVICTVFCSTGDLLNVLRKHELHFMSSSKCDRVEICLLLPDLLRLAIEVSNGLCYLFSHNYVHRDIAARNVLLTESLQAKLSDFGLCKKLEEHDICIIDKKGKFPVKYMPYESLKFGEFSFKTDVWSYGILLFEMFSGGKPPFENILQSVDELVDYLEKDGKPAMSESTPQPMIQFLNEKIFQKYPSRRATFAEIKQGLLNFYSIVCNVLMEKDGKRNNIGGGSVRNSVRRRV